MNQREEKFDIQNGECQQRQALFRFGGKKETNSVV